ncbi:MAG: asparaginase domain-containing protein [Pseudomonadota bacterium]
MSDDRAPVRVLYTGGTIGCSGTPFSPMPGAQFQELCASNGLGTDCAWEWTDTALDSAEVGPRDWAGLALRVLADDRPVVVLHGTDTMAWSAAALALLTTLLTPDGVPVARRSAPVVFTGAQRPLFPSGAERDPGSDGAANLRAALVEATRPVPGVRIAFGGQIINGARAVKQSTLEDCAFSSPNGADVSPPLPAATSEPLRDAVVALEPHMGARQVFPVPLMPGGGRQAAESIALAMDALGPRLGAVHLLGFGLGTVPGREPLTPVLARAADLDIIVALGTQVHKGPVEPAHYGAGAWTGPLGVLPAGDMTVPATQAKLHLSLALATIHGWKTGTSHNFMEQSIAGERSA